jgi:ribosomal protein S18 acetylase RimI-like enzyme
MDDLLVTPAAPAEWPNVLELVFGHLLEDDRRRQVETALAAALSGEASLDGLLGAHRGGRLVGGVLSQIQPGKTAAVWLPRTVRWEGETTASKLLAAACDWLSQHDLCTAQILAETCTASEAAMLRQWGFDPLADLLYLVSQEDEFPHSAPLTLLEFQSYSESNHDRLARVVEATYEQTLDCPRLGGVRDIEDVLAGYRGTGVFNPGRWLIVRHRGVDVGCLLLADHPQHENYELVYMGVTATARGRGWGTEITRYAQWLTRRAGRPRLVLAVDAANQPAIRMYAAAGFQAFERRSVFLKLLRQPRR